jgi:hypothetical protein
MCKEVIIGDTACSNHGELTEALGGVPAYKHDEDITDDDCLCGIDVEETAKRYNLTIDGELSDHWQTVMRKDEIRGH